MNQIYTVHVFDRVSWILQLGVWESAGLWVESDAPKLSSVSVPGSVTSAPWEEQKCREIMKESEEKEKKEIKMMDIKC